MCLRQKRSRQSRLLQKEVHHPERRECAQDRWGRRWTEPNWRHSLTRRCTAQQPGCHETSILSRGVKKPKLPSTFPFRSPRAGASILSRCNRSFRKQRKPRFARQNRSQKAPNLSANRQLARWHELLPGKSVVRREARRQAGPLNRARISMCSGGCFGGCCVGNSVHLRATQCDRPK